jgi:predicted transcriptional regulator
MGRGQAGQQEEAVSKKLTPEEAASLISINVRVSPEQFQALEAMAKRERRSRSNMAAVLLEQALLEQAGQSAADYLKAAEAWR